MSYDRTDANLVAPQGVVSPGKFSDHLRVSIKDGRARYALRAKPAAVGSIKERTGLPLPTRINQSAEDKTIRLLCLGPDEWLLVTDDGADLQARFDFGIVESPTLPFSLVDVSQRNVAMEVSGRKAEQAMKTGCPLDLSLASFPVGKVTRTVFERAEIVLFRKAPDAFEIEIWRSFAPYLLALLEKAAKSI